MKAPKFLQRIFSSPAPQSASLERRIVELETKLGQKRMYQAAMTNRLTSDWPVSISSANAEIMVSAKAVRSRNEQLQRDDPYMRRIVRLFQNNVIGHRGIRLQMKLKKRNGTYDRDSNEKVKDAWEKAGKARNCTTSRRLSRVQVRRLVMAHLVTSGGCLLRKHEGFNNEFGYALEPINLRRLDHDYNLPLGGINNRVQFGVEINDLFEPVAYHILTRDPGDTFAYGSSPRYRERVLASDIIPVWDIENIGQLAPMPITTGILVRLNHLDKFDTAAVIAAREGANQGGWFEKKIPDTGYEGADDGQGNQLADTEPGQWQELPVGLVPHERKPPYPNDSYAPFVKAQLRGAASGVNLSYNTLANDLEGVNYSSIRAGLLEDREEYKTWQELFCEQLEQPDFEAWVPCAIMSGELALPLSMVDAIREAACWQPRRWPWVDPKNDIEASLMAVEGKTTSLRRIIAENGGDIEEVFEEQEEDKQLAEDHGLELTPVTAPTIPKGDPDPALANPKANGNGKSNGRFYPSGQRDVQPGARPGTATAIVDA